MQHPPQILPLAVPAGLAGAWIFTAETVLERGFPLASNWGPRGVLFLRVLPGFWFKSVLFPLGSDAESRGCCTGEAVEPAGKQSIPTAPSIIFEPSWFFGGLTHGAGMRWAGNPRPAPWWRGRAAVSSSLFPSPSPPQNRLAGLGAATCLLSLEF